MMKRLTKREYKALYGKGRVNKWDDPRRMGVAGAITPRTPYQRNTASTCPRAQEV